MGNGQRVYGFQNIPVAYYVLCNTKQFSKCQLNEPTRRSHFPKNDNFFPFFSTKKNKKKKNEQNGKITISCSIRFQVHFSEWES